MSVQDKVAQYITDNGIKQAFICQQTGISKNALSAMLNSQRKMSVSEFEQICRALKARPGLFIDEE